LETQGDFVRFRVRYSSALVLVIALLILLDAAVNTAEAQTFGIQYGPRAFWTAPVGTNAIDLKYENLRGGIDINGNILEGFDLQTHSAIASYTRYFDVFGNSASVVAALPYVWLSGELDTKSSDIPLFGESGITDPYFQFYTTLLGGEALPAQEYVRKEPGFVMGLFGATRVPVGEYDPSKPANPGANRWEWRLGIPIQYVWGLPTQQTSIEFVPTFYLLGDNDEAFGGGTLSQAPLYQFEGHVTHDIKRMFFVSFNILHAFGSQTSIDGVNQDDALAYTSAGVTVAARLSRTFSVNASYSRRFWSKQDATDGEWFRFSFTTTF
jgi:hypothetical protein